MDDLRLPKLVERFTLGQDVAVDFIAVGEVESQRRMHLRRAQGCSDTMSSADMPETSAKPGQPQGARSKRTLQRSVSFRRSAAKLAAMSATKSLAGADASLVVPDELPFLGSLSWFDAGWRELSPLEMLQRYERGWRHRGVTADPSREELAFVRALVERFGSVLDVPA